MYLVFTKVGLHLLRKAASNPFSETDGLSTITNIDTFLSPLTALPGIVFIFLFACGCKKLIHNEYKYAITLGCLSVAVEVVSFIGDVVDINPAIPFVIMALLSIAGLVMAVLLTRSFVHNYSGELRYLGVCMRDALRFVFIVLGTIILGVILFLLTDSYGVGMAFIIVAGCLGLYTLYLTYLVLQQMNWILEAGHVAQLSDNDLEGYLHGLAPDRSSTNSVQPREYSDKDMNKSKDSWKQSVTTKIIIGVFCVAVLATLVFVITNRSSESTDEYPELIINDENYEDEYDYGAEEDGVPSKFEDVYSEADSYEASEASIPDWIPDYIRQSMIADKCVPASPDDEECISVNYKGSINAYPITMQLFINPDGSVRGKYAYNSTLRKYGDVKPSWFRIEGDIFDSERDYQKIVFRSYAPDTGNVFEYWDLRYEGAEMHGSMFNVKHIDNPTESLYKVSLQRQE